LTDNDIVITRGHEVLVDAFPDCDVCRLEGYKPMRKARYDSNCRLGGWMNLCTTHYRDYGRGTGVGVGQRLIKRPA
jgi:hypothetical protein